MATVQASPSVSEVCAQARCASRALAHLSNEAKNAALGAMAEAVRARTDEILAANRLDLEAGREAGLEAALMDRLALDAERVAAMAQGVRDIAALPDPVGEELEHRTLANGLEMSKVRVPLGVIAVIYEARPNVTVDCAALCIKSGNAVILRGSSTAAHSNAALGAIITDAGLEAGLPEGAISLLGGGGHDELRELIGQEGSVDLAVPRGGEGLKATLKQHAAVPVLYAASGNCHVYIDAGADPDMARAIAVNAKVQRPGVCNAAETLLVHSEAAPAVLPETFRELSEAGVELRTDARARSLAGPAGEGLGEATEEDWRTEYHDLVLAVRVVDSVEEAIEHINAYGTGHSDAIVTSSDQAAREFTDGVDSACVYVNASTRFTDGAEFGMGAEIGNSTQKLHARGPIGLRELCTYKYVVQGTGQVRS